MAKVLSSITLDAPAAPVTADINDTFAFTGTPGFAGGGGVQRYDFRWEVDDGGGFVPIAASGSGLITAGTNPVVNTNSQAAQSITVTCDAPGTYVIRMVGAPVSGGSYTVLSATQDVTVSSGPEEHFGTLAVSGGGSVAAAASKQALVILPIGGGGSAAVVIATARLVSLGVTGGGAVLLSVMTARAIALAVAGGGSVTITYQVSGEEHFGTLAVSGGGAVATAAGKQAFVILPLSGGGSVALAAEGQRSGALGVQGGGQVALSGLGGRLAALGVSGGGSASLSASSARLVALLASGGGSLSVVAATAREGALMIQGGGSVIIEYDLAERHSGVLLVSGGGAVDILATSARLAGLQVQGGGGVALARLTDRFVVLAVSGGGRVFIVTQGGLVPAPPIGTIAFHRWEIFDATPQQIADEHLAVAGAYPADVSLALTTRGLGGGKARDLSGVRLTRKLLLASALIIEQHGLPRAWWQVG
jgi:hypothetical protein